MGSIITVDEQIDAVIGREGDYSNHPADRGGPTRWGVTQATARAAKYDGDMRVFPRDAAVEIYRRLYWSKPGLEAVAKRCPAIAAELFDIGVNMGPATGIGFLQRCLNAFNNGGRIYGDIVVDGRSGPGTLSALDGYVAERGAAGEERLLEAIRSLRGERYIAICESRPANEAFTYGWFGRMAEMLRARFKRSGGGAAIVLALLVPLGGCATTIPTSRVELVQRASIEVDRLIRINAAAQAAVRIFLPWLPPERAARVREAAARADDAIERVRAARDLAAQAAAIEAATTAITEYKWLAGA